MNFVKLSTSSCARSPAWARTSESEQGCAEETGGSRASTFGGDQSGPRVFCFVALDVGAELFGACAASGAKLHAASAAVSRARAAVEVRREIRLRDCPVNEFEIVASGILAGA